MSTIKLLQQKAYDYLKEQILSGEMIDGQIYSETKIAQEMNISRTPMRDALQRLSQDGFIDIIPSKGFKLHKITTNDIIETFQVRSAIEGFCAFLITKEHDSDKALKTIEELEYLCNKQEEIFNTNGDIESFIKYDNLFHIAIVQYAQNNEFDKMFNRYMYRIKKLAVDSLSHTGRMESTIKEHLNILDCIKSGNTHNIYSVTSIHMEIPKSINLNDFSNEL